MEKALTQKEEKEKEKRPCLIETGKNTASLNETDSNRRLQLLNYSSATDLTTIHQRLHNPSLQPSKIADLVPQRAGLRIKKSLRCRKCVSAGKPNIVVKSQINPLKGDSSLRTNVGSWYKKSSFAYNYVPRIFALSFSDPVSEP